MSGINLSVVKSNYELFFILYCYFLYKRNKYPDMCIAYSFGFVWLNFSGHVYCIHFGFVFFWSLYIQVIQGFIHADHEDLINKHVMMTRFICFRTTIDSWAEVTSWGSREAWYRVIRVLPQWQISLWYFWCLRMGKIDVIAYKYVIINRLMHALFHIKTVIIPRDRYRPEGFSPMVAIGRGIITVLIWKKSCINLFITYFNIELKRTKLTSHTDTKLMDMSDRYWSRVLLPKRQQIFPRWTSTFSKRQLTVGWKWRHGAHERLDIVLSEFCPDGTSGVYKWETLTLLLNMRQA
jgi:hypothetical protein